MKINLTWFIVLIISCSMLVGCGKSKPAKETEKLIAAIGEVTLDSEKDIIVAEDYYNTLTSDQKNEIETYKILVDARNQYDELVKQESIKGILGNWTIISVGIGDTFASEDEISKHGYTLKGKMTITSDSFSYEIGEKKDSGTWDVYEQDDDMIIYSLSGSDEYYACIYSDEPDALLLTMDVLNMIFVRE